tara:strand:+ start:120 stop:389 length:270 start_codon:yes stop_codon:yes gene_type:complete
MPKIMASFQVKDWETWASAFDGHSDAREKANINTIYYGHELEDKNKVHIIMDVPSVETLQNFMMQPENQQLIEESGHMQETMQMVVCSD